jgi:hypothetical protein
MTDTAQQQPAWMTALSPYLVELISVPLATPIRVRIVGDLIPDVHGAVVRFPQWTGPAFVDDLGKKSAAFVEVDGEHLFAPLAVLRLLERDGWEGRWVITRGGAHGEVWKLLTRWLDVPRAEQKHVPIEDARPRQLLATIAHANKPGRYAGCWELFTWRGDEYLFFQCKRASSSKKDWLSRQQEEWMRMALAAQPGVLRADSFCVVEWDYV